MKRALILVDIQPDFMPGGNLAVADGHLVVEAANTLIRYFDKHSDIVVATQDWHPADHGSFASASKVTLFSLFDLNGLSQVAWPDHCVQGTPGAELHKDLEKGPIRAIFRKGMDRKVDSYSGFADNGGKNDTGLDAYLRSQGVTEVCVVGLATDYCVKFTALDALKRGYRAVIVPEACRAVGGPDASKAALVEFVEAGGTIGSV